MPEKKYPVRQCIGCREHRQKRDLLRVVRTPEGEIVLDVTGKKNGRGAYICRGAVCLAKAQKSRALERHLGGPVGSEVFAALSDAAAKEAKPGET